MYANPQILEELLLLCRGPLLKRLTLCLIVYKSYEVRVILRVATDPRNEWLLFAAWDANALVSLILVPSDQGFFARIVNRLINLLAHFRMPLLQLRDSSIALLWRITRLQLKPLHDVGQSERLKVLVRKVGLRLKTVRRRRISSFLDHYLTLTN